MMDDVALMEQLELTEEQVQRVVALMKLEGWTRESHRSVSEYVYDVLGEELYTRWLAPAYEMRAAQYRRIRAYFGMAGE